MRVPGATPSCLAGWMAQTVLLSVSKVDLVASAPLGGHSYCSVSHAKRAATPLPVLIASASLAKVTSRSRSATLPSVLSAVTR